MKKAFIYIFLLFSILSLSSCFKYKGIPSTSYSYFNIDDYNVSYTYEEYQQAENESLVVITGYIQGIVDHDEDIKTLYLFDDEGGYVVNRLYCPDDLSIGTKISVVGIKSVRHDMHFIRGAGKNRASYKVLPDNKIFDSIEINLTEISSYYYQKISITELNVIQKIYDINNDTLMLKLSDSLNNIIWIRYNKNLIGVDDELIDIFLSIEVGDLVRVEGFFITNVIECVELVKL